MDSLMQEASSYGTSFQVSPYRVLGSARARATRPVGSFSRHGQLQADRDQPERTSSLWIRTGWDQMNVYCSKDLTT